MLKISPKDALALILFFLIGACGSPRQAAPDLSHPDQFDARVLPMFDGTNGASLSWVELQARIESADVVLVGEQHDDHIGHLFQQAVVESVLSKYAHSAVSLEMLERDEQSYVNDYLAGIISLEQFLRRTPIAWRPGPTWLAWYQVVIESARIHERAVIAANAPRRYVSLAKTGGHEALRAIGKPSSEYFSISDLPSTGGYLDRYRSFFMEGHGSGEVVDETQLSEEELLAKEAALEASFRSQSLWDSTMAASIVGHLGRHSGKVVHLVGQFHSDFEGGLVQQLKHLQPQLRLLVISMQSKSLLSLAVEDEQRADVVVYTALP